MSDACIKDPHSITPFIHRIDAEGTSALYLSVPPQNIVAVQAIIESYEGIGVLRTLNESMSLLALYTTAHLAGSALKLLESLALQFGLRFHSKEAVSNLGILDIDFDTLLKKGLKC